MPDNPFAVVITSVERACRDDREGALKVLQYADVPHQHLAQAALMVFSSVLAGDGAAARYRELRARVHQLAVDVGAGDAQVILCLEVLAVAEALTGGDPDRARDVADGSSFSPLDYAYAAVAFTGQAISGWLGPERTSGLFAALRREYGVEGAA